MKDLPRVCHVITGLPVGGAQTALSQLAAHRQRLGCEMEVISLTETGPVGKRIQDLGVRVRALGMSGINPVPPLRLTAWLRQSAPDVVQTWLYHADLIGGVAARLARVPTVYTPCPTASCAAPKRLVRCIWLLATMIRGCLSSTTASTFLCSSPIRSRVRRSGTNSASRPIPF